MSSKRNGNTSNRGESETKTSNIEDRVSAEELLELYLEDRRSSMNGQTPRSHRSRLSFWVEWFESETEYNYVDEISRTDILRFKKWRFVTEEDVRESDDLTENDIHATTTVKTQMDTLRRLLSWAETHGLVAEDIHIAAESPDTDDDDDIAHRYVDPDRLQEHLEWLRTYEWGQRQTVVLAIIWETAMRRSAVRALDVSDWNSDEQVLHVRNREEEATRLKNGGKGERDVAVTDRTAELIDAWIEGPRPNETDENGREPLITTTQGRVSGGCIQTDVYDALRPRRIREECSCEGSGCKASGKSNAYLCEDTEGPHAVRATSITYHLNQGWPIEYVSDRADCSKKVIEKHYDEATETEKMERRRDFVDEL